MSEKFEADYVIIGGGTAGSILAARLASESNKRVIVFVNLLIILTWSFVIAVPEEETTFVMFF